MTRLAIFDMDGTLIDSKAHIVAAMRAAFARVEQEAPERHMLLSVVGLSLNHAFEHLLPGQSPATYHAMQDAYRTHSQSVTLDAPAPLFDGMRALLERLSQHEGLMLAVATGASARGMNSALHANGISHHFASLQCADHHPSKPNPSMVQACVDECGASVRDAIVIGDTTYDIEMAHAAGCASVGVLWGNHGHDALLSAQANTVVETTEQLERALDAIWEE
jgi:phosphoglycolate phosphatase